MASRGSKFAPPPGPDRGALPDRAFGFYVALTLGANAAVTLPSNRRLTVPQERRTFDNHLHTFVRRRRIPFISVIVALLPAN